MDGILVIDKPVGFTSHDIVQQVRRWAHQRRVGHLGTLDPLATGVLPIALGEATKLSRLLTLGEKVYRGRIRLGIETTTYDREGDEVARPSGPWPERSVVTKALEAFRGSIEQVPPPYSAVKRGGEAAYRKARRGEAVALEPRQVTIHELRLIDYAPPDVHVEVRCSAGTYLRSLAHDLGRQVGCGATLWDLARLQSGPFRIESALAPDALEERGEAALIPMVEATGLPSYEVDARTAERVAHGVQLGRHEVRGAPARGLLQLVRRGRLVALLEAEPGIPELRTQRVFLEGTES
ncbi:MAG: tRNA pseudouridine(55) synthase TruB [Myxococcota bacterium]